MTRVRIQFKSFEMLIYHHADLSHLSKVRTYCIMPISGNEARAVVTTLPQLAEEGDAAGAKVTTFAMTAPGSGDLNKQASESALPQTQDNGMFICVCSVM